MLTYPPLLSPAIVTIAYDTLRWFWCMLSYASSFTVQVYMCIYTYEYKFVLLILYENIFIKKICF